MAQRLHTAAIVPAHNEEATIGNVVRVLLSSPLIDEVIVVSDGSTDRTVEVARQAGAVVQARSHRGGKGAALLHGVKETRAPILAFFDADLKGFTADHVERLLLPVLSGAKYMNVGLRDRGRFITNLTRHLPLISGERAFRREVMENIPPEYVQGFMVEAAMNYYCRSRRLRYGSVAMPGLTIRHKWEKVGIRKAFFQYVIMFAEVAKAMMIVRLARLCKQF